MTVLVAGGSGVVGAATAQALQQDGAEVVCLSRSGTAPVGLALRGDVRDPRLGLARNDFERLCGTVTHVVSCFGSVDWASGPRTAADLHLRGTRHLLRFAAKCSQLERIVHVSSVLVLGRAVGPLGNRHLDVGQRFRTWYEVGKFLAERAVREEAPVPWRIVRVGPVLGAGGPVRASGRDGLLAIVPYLLRGYPTHLSAGGAFPCWVGESVAAGKLVAQATRATGEQSTWTWFDDQRPTLAAVLTAVCAAWSVVPRLVDWPVAGVLSRALAGRLSLPSALQRYAEPWVDLEEDILSELPRSAPTCPDGYLHETGEALRRQAARIRS